MTREVYIVIDRAGDVLFRRFCDTTRRETVLDIIRGEISDVRNVLCINPEENSCRDVTEDIARDVMNETGCSLSAGARDLVEDQIGVRAAAESDE
jgi:hypothetical protein